MNYYLNQRVTKKIGTDDLSNYELVKGENPVSNFLRENQEQSLTKRKELIEIYNSQQKGDQLRASLRKNEN